VVSGARHLAVRRRLDPATLVLAAAALAAGVAMLFGIGRAAMSACTVIFAVQIAVESRHATGIRRVALVGIAVATGAGGLFRPALFALAAAHLHALGSLVFFALAARARRIPLWPAALALVIVFAGGLA